MCSISLIFRWLFFTSVLTFNVLTSKTVSIRTDSLNFLKQNNFCNYEVLLIFKSLFLVRNFPYSINKNKNHKRHAEQLLLI